jgi:hypothetical protein
VRHFCTDVFLEIYLNNVPFIVIIQDLAAVDLAELDLDVN